MHAAKLQMVWHYECKWSIMPLKCIKLKNERKTGWDKEKESETERDTDILVSFEDRVLKLSQTY